MAELTFDQLSLQEKEDVLAFYNSQGLDEEGIASFYDSQGQNIGTPITEATLPPPRSSLSPPPVDVTSLDTGQPVAPVTRSWRDDVYARDVSPTRGIMTEAPDMDMVQNFQERNGLPRDGIFDEATARAMSAQALGQPAAPDTPPVAQEDPTQPVPTEAPAVYSIQAGDTLSEIASENTFTLDQLIAANPDITNPSNIQIGQEINLPVVGAPSTADIPETVEYVAEVLPTEIAETVETAGAETEQEVNIAIFDGANFSGELPTPSVEDDPITWLVENLYGVREENPEFRRALQGIFQGVDPDKIPWCAALVGHVLRNIDVALPEDATVNPNLAFNYQNLGESVYDHNPTTGRTYQGSLDDVQAGDVIVFNKVRNRQRDGSFSWGRGHISFVVGTREDGTILALGGNQSDRVQVSEYTPDVIRTNYAGGFRIRRITTQALEQTSPEVIAAITSDMAEGGPGE